MNNEARIILENKAFRLTLSERGFAHSLVLKATGTECISQRGIPFFSLTENRLYNNEQKLAHPTGSIALSAIRIRKEGDRLIVGFELIDFEAVVKVEIKERYMLFSLEDFIVRADSFGLGTTPMLPPVNSFRLVQLGVSLTEKFGEWLNVAYIGDAAVNVLAACPYVKVGAESADIGRTLYGESVSGIGLKGKEVALIVSKSDELMDTIGELEEDLDLPRGVKSRRSKEINRSYYWVCDIDPKNAGEHIACAKRGGFKYMLIYYSAFLNEPGAFRGVGNYGEYRPSYENGRDSLESMLGEIKQAGIVPGLHILHTHIGLRTKYLTRIADHRLNLKRHFTLSRGASESDSDIYVEENPEGMPIYEKARILRFGGELIKYESYSEEPPYRFTGCERGFNGTFKKSHETGDIGGVLDISEYCANSAYINQRTSLQDEIASEIADIYNLGFEFIYFDGSKGVDPPAEINVGLAQWRVYRKLKRKPLFCEGAAKSNYSWHMLSGGNAFDILDADVFKEMTVQHPFAEAKRMANDLTRVNFGWWALSNKMRPDIIEYGTALAAASDSPGAFRCDMHVLRTHPRLDDILEVTRRWELARECGFITEDIKKELQKTEIEHTLLLNENGELELAAYEEAVGAAGGSREISAFVFERGEMSYASILHKSGEGTLSLPKCLEGAFYTDELYLQKRLVTSKNGELTVPVGKRRYLITKLSKAELLSALEESKLLNM